MEILEKIKQELIALKGQIFLTKEFREVLEKACKKHQGANECRVELIPDVNKVTITCKISLNQDILPAVLALCDLKIIGNPIDGGALEIKDVEIKKV